MLQLSTNDKNIFLVVTEKWNIAERIYHTVACLGAIQINLSSLIRICQTMHWKQVWSQSSDIKLPRLSER